MAVPVLTSLFLKRKGDKRSSRSKKKAGLLASQEKAARELSITEGRRLRRDEIAAARSINTPGSLLSGLPGKLG